MSVAVLPPPHRSAANRGRIGYDVFLWVLFLGPIASPLFRIGGLPVLSDSGELARTLLATYVCPTPERSVLLFGFPMAVCMRCWGATIGLWIARIAAQRRHPLLTAFFGLDWRVRLVLAALPFLLWPLEIVGHYQGLWFAPLWLLLINGMQAGFAAGLFFVSVWPGVLPAERSI
jgi:uncharacterized membrane protein